MKYRGFAQSAFTAMIAAVLSLPLSLAAQQQTRYKAVDMGTFGGSQSYFNFSAQNLNSHGMVAGSADTTTPDPNFPNFGACFNPDCLFSHGFQSQNGAAPTDLGTLPGGGLSSASWISDSGLIVGASQNGVTDPLTGGSEFRAVAWSNG